MCRRLLFVETGTKLLVEPLLGGSQMGKFWDIGTPAPVALADINHQPGAEIIVRVAAGRVTEFAAIYTVRHDQIVSYSMPRTWTDGGAINYGWSDAGASYSWSATTATCIGRRTGLIAWSRATPTPWPPSPRVRPRYVISQTRLQAIGLRFRVVSETRTILNRLPSEFASSPHRGKSQEFSDRIFPNCAKAHDWNADIPVPPDAPPGG
jgi:hypothetical protein